MKRYYGISQEEFRKMDEIQVQNRMADLKKLLEMERKNIALGVWGPKQKGGETDGAASGRRKRNR